MNIPERFYKEIYSTADFQENIDFDSNGNELYHGIASNTVKNSDPAWIIAKGIYSTITVNGISVTVMTHVSFLRGQIWNNRASITFP